MPNKSEILNHYAPIKLSVQQNFGDNYWEWNDIADYTVPDGKIVLARVDVYRSSEANNYFTGLWWKMKPNMIIVDVSVVKKASPFIFGSNIRDLDNGHWVWDNIAEEFKESAMEAIQDMKPAIMRFPRSSYYTWHYGIGYPRSARQVQPSGIPSDFGTDEFMEFIRLIDSKAVLVIENDLVTKGTAKEAAAWVAYVNGKVGDNTLIGVDESGTDWKTVDYWVQQRISNCLALFNKNCTEPYGVVYWEIGNENYAFMPVSEYATKFRSFQNEMKRIDSSINIGAVGYHWSDLVGQVDSSNKWNEYLIQEVGDIMDFIVVHYHNWEAHPASLWEEETDKLKGYIGSMDIDIAITEHNVCFHKQDGECIDKSPTDPVCICKDAKTYSMRSALYQAGIFLMALRDNNISMTNTWHLTAKGIYPGWDFFGNLVIEDAVSETGLDVLKRPSFYSFYLFTNKFTTDIVKTEFTSQLINENDLSLPKNALDVATSIDTSQNKLYILILNSGKEEITPTIIIKSFNPKSTAEVHTLAPKTGGINAINDVDPNNVVIETTQIKNIGSTFEYTLEPYSITVIELTSV